MATKKRSTVKKKRTATRRPAAKKTARPAAKKKSAPRKRTKPGAAPATMVAETGDRLSEAARAIGSTMGEIVAKTKRALQGEPEEKS